LPSLYRNVTITGDPEALILRGDSNMLREGMMPFHSKVLNIAYVISISYTEALIRKYIHYCRAIDTQAG
jgi:hypothetical protein